LIGNPIREERSLVWRRILKRLFIDSGENVILSPKNSKIFKTFSVKGNLKRRNN
jgi:hypothetical protein